VLCFQLTDRCETVDTVTFDSVGFDDEDAAVDTRGDADVSVTKFRIAEVLLDDLGVGCLAPIDATVEFFRLIRLLLR
jgi:hypothetical protein